MPPFRDAPARRVNERETGASLGLETGTVAAGVEVAGVVGVVEASGVEETGTFGVIEVSGEAESDTVGVVVASGLGVKETSGVVVVGGFGVKEISGVVVVGGFGVEEISGVAEISGVVETSGVVTALVALGEVEAVFGGEVLYIGADDTDGMWVSRGNSDILEFKEGAFVPSEVQPQKSAVMML